MSDLPVSAVLLTFRSAAAATILVTPVAAAVAYVLARFSFRGKALLSGITSLPLVVPPTAVGFLLLRLLAVNGLLGRILQDLGVEVLFTWRAVVIAYSVMALPLMVRTMRIAFEDVHPKYEQVARTLGYGPFRVFFEVTLPASWKGVLAGAILGFTRAVGEFGASITIGGNIAGQTRTLASAIYTAEQAGHREQAYALIVVAVLIGLATVVSTEYLSSRAGGAVNKGRG